RYSAECRCQARRSRKEQLPPCFGLHAVTKPAGSVLERDAAHQTAEAVGPIRVSHEQAQDRLAKELTARSDLRCDCELTQPTVELPVAILGSHKTVGVINPSFKRQGKIFGEEDFRPRAKRCPIVEAMARLPVPLPLKDEDRHDGESVVRLKEQV